MFPKQGTPSVGTSSCSCTNLDMKPKAVEEGVKKAQCPADCVTPGQGRAVQVGQ